MSENNFIRSSFIFNRNTKQQFALEEYIQSSRLYYTKEEVTREATVMANLMGQ